MTTATREPAPAHLIEDRDIAEVLPDVSVDATWLAIRAERIRVLTVRLRDWSNALGEAHPGGGVHAVERAHATTTELVHLLGGCPADA